MEVRFIYWLLYVNCINKAKNACINFLFPSGTTVSLHLKEEAYDFLEVDTVKSLVRKYSQFINFPIYLWESKTEEVEEPLDEDEAEAEAESDEDKVVYIWELEKFFLNIFNAMWLEYIAN